MDIQRSLPTGSFLRAVINGADTLLELSTQTPNSPFANSFQLLLKGPSNECQSLDGSSVLGGVRFVSPSMSYTTIKNIVGEANYNTGTDADAPWGVGVSVHFKPGKYEVGVLEPSIQSSFVAPTHSSVVLYFSKHSTVTADTAVIKPLDDRKAKRGISGRGQLVNIIVDGANDAADAGHAFNVHGYWGTQPVGTGECHTMYECEFLKCKGDGIRIDNRHQFIAIRPKCSNNTGIAANFTDMNDSKIYSPGFSGGVQFDHCATPKVFGGDFFLPNDASKPWTLRLIDQSRLEIFGTEISGRAVAEGKNHGNTNRYEYAGNKFIGVNFKIDETLTPSYTYTRFDNTTVAGVSATFYIEDCDGFIFDSCTLIYADTVPTAPQLAATPDYFIQVGSRTGNSVRSGQITMRNASGMVHRRGRPAAVDAGYAPVVAWKKRFCNRPDLIAWDFTPGVLDLVRYDPGATPPINLPDTHILPAAGLAKTDYPLGYEWFTGGSQDDGTPTFTISAAGHPVAPAGWTWAARVWP